jgi:hypothetical protein
MGNKVALIIRKYLQKVLHDASGTGTVKELTFAQAMDAMESTSRSTPNIIGRNWNFAFPHSGSFYI